MPLPDIVSTNPVDPFRPDPASEDEYSLKFKMSRRLFGLGESISVFTGQLPHEPEGRVVGLQAAILNALEQVIQLVFDSTFTNPTIPVLSKPDSFVFTNGDILVSWAGQLDYMILRGTGASRQVTFLTDSTPPEVDVIANMLTFTKTYNGSLNSTSYDLTFESDGSFTILGPFGTGTVTYDSTGSTGTFRGEDLSRTEDVVTGIIILKGTAFSDVGITVYPLVGDPSDYGNDDFATGTQAVIYDPLFPIPFATFHTYMTEDYTGTRGSLIQCFLRSLFLQLQNSIRHMLKPSPDDVFNIRTGFTCLVESCGVTTDIRLT